MKRINSTGVKIVYNIGGRIFTINSRNSTSELILFEQNINVIINILVYL